MSQSLNQIKTRFAIYNEMRPLSHLIFENNSADVAKTFTSFTSKKLQFSTEKKKDSKACLNENIKFSLSMCLSDS